MNSKKVAFIICINDWQEYEECKFYLDRLHIPSGYEKDIITIQEAPSMAAGYNAGMQSSDAKYKVYLHQDVYIKNIDFIEDMLYVFGLDSKIGLMGMIGTRNLGENAFAVSAWDTGKIYDNSVPPLQEYAMDNENYLEVEAVDGLLLATQYDVLWREDLFDGWDYYDISQCMEMKRAGYKVVVPNQKEVWCYHDNSYSKMVEYTIYQRKFVEEYKEMGNFKLPEISESFLEYSQAKEVVRREVKQLIVTGDKEELRKIFGNPNNQGYIYLREYESISNIDLKEEQALVQERYWKNGMSYEELILKLRQLKYSLKRMEFGADDVCELAKKIVKDYSVYAIEEVINQYIVEKKSVWRTLFSIQRTEKSWQKMYNYLCNEKE